MIHHWVHPVSSEATSETGQGEDSSAGGHLRLHEWVSLMMVCSGRNSEWSRVGGFLYTQNNVEDVTGDGRVMNASVGAQKTVDKPQMDSTVQKQNSSRCSRKAVAYKVWGGNSCALQCKTKLVNDLKNWPAIPDYLCVTARSLYWLHIFPDVQFLF